MWATQGGQLRGAGVCDPWRGGVGSPCGRRSAWRQRPSRCGWMLTAALVERRSRPPPASRRRCLSSAAGWSPRRRGLPPPVPPPPKRLGCRVLGRRRGGRCGGVPAHGVGCGSRRCPAAQGQRGCADVRAAGGGGWRRAVVVGGRGGEGGAPRGCLLTSTARRSFWGRGRGPPPPRWTQP